LGLTAENAQVGNAAQHAVYEEAVKDHIAATRRRGIALDCVVCDPATETITAAFSVEPEQVIAIGGRLDGPELPDQAAFDKDVVHRGHPQPRVRLRFPSSVIPSASDAVFPNFVQSFSIA